MTREELKSIMQTIQSEYRDFGITQQKFDFWYDCLKDYNAEIMKQALCRYARASSYSPNIAGLCKQYDVVRDEIRRENGLLRETFEHLTHIYPYGDMKEAQTAFWEYLENLTHKQLAAEALLERARGSIETQEEMKPLAELIRGEK
jgi:hypothetical protein